MTVEQIINRLEQISKDGYDKVEVAINEDVFKYVKSVYIDKSEEPFCCVIE